MEADLLYYRRRSAEEVAAAEVATDDRARAIHLDLARAYRQRVLVLEAERSGTHLRVVSAA